MLPDPLPEEHEVGPGSIKISQHARLYITQYVIYIADEDLLWKSDIQVMLILVSLTTTFLAKVLSSLAAEDACFRKRITLGVVLIGSLVFHVCVPECSRNGFGMRPYLLVQEDVV